MRIYSHTQAQSASLCGLVHLCAERHISRTINAAIVVRSIPKPGHLEKRHHATYIASGDTHFRPEIG